MKKYCEMKLVEVSAAGETETGWGESYTLYADCLGHYYFQCDDNGRDLIACSKNDSLSEAMEEMKEYVNALNTRG